MGIASDLASGQRLRFHFQIYFGVDIGAHSGVRIRGLTVVNAMDSGFFIDTGTNNTLIGNTANNNAYFDIYMQPLVALFQGFMPGS